MKLLKNMALIFLTVALNGCTVLGFATDLALESASDNNHKQGEPNHGYNSPLFFTKEGLKHDVKVVKNLMNELSNSQDDFKPALQEEKLIPALTCKNVEDGKQQCYPPEYYKDMYIKDDIDQELETNSTQF